jgi:chitinase
VTTRIKRLFAALLSGLVVITGAALMSTTSVSAATNPVANPGFETGSLSPWTCDPGTSTVMTSPVHSGSYALAATPTSALTAKCSQTVSVQPNTSYTLSAWVLGNYAYIGDTGTGTSDTSNWASTSTWQQLSTSFTTGASTSSVSIWVHGWYSQGTVYADDVLLTASGGGTPPPTTTTTSTTTTTTTPAPPPPTTSTTTTTVAPPPAGGVKNLGYFAEWGVYQRNYHVKNIVTSGSASKLTHINYAFGNVTNGACAVGDAYADYQKVYTATDSVNGTADSSSGLAGSFHQLLELKAMYPTIKVLWSFGGWTWSGGFGQAAQNPAAFADSCYNLIHDPRWNGVFDGIDIDWEYPNACGNTCDSSGFSSYKNLMSALRARFGSSSLVTGAITADGTNGGKIDAADYGGASQYVDWYNVMTYDYFGAWASTGPTAPHSPLTSYSGIPVQSFYADAAIQKLKGKGIPSTKLLLGIGFYGRGWTGVTQSAPGGTATGPAPGTYEQGIEDYKILKVNCPSNGLVAGTAYAYCGSQWWSYDTPSTIAGKMSYTKNQGLGGAFFWEFSGDTTNGELITAMRAGLG